MSVLSVQSALVLWVASVLIAAVSWSAVRVEFPTTCNDGLLAFPTSPIPSISNQNIVTDSDRAGGHDIAIDSDVLICLTHDRLEDRRVFLDVVALRMHRHSASWSWRSTAELEVTDRQRSMEGVVKRNNSPLTGPAGTVVLTASPRLRRAAMGVQRFRESDYSLQRDVVIRS